MALSTSDSEKKRTHWQEEEEEYSGTQCLYPRIGWKEEQKVLVYSYFPKDDQGAASPVWKNMNPPWKHPWACSCYHADDHAHVSPP
jgi:hypothetical protein